MFTNQYVPQCYRCWIIFDLAILSSSHVENVRAPPGVQNHYEHDIDCQVKNATQTQECEPAPHAHTRGCLFD